ncbi:MAG: transglycosylase domain-containing protein [Clostridia bacterium]|nr:transglycosylase domain-containing protein [Clostridia bacterium]
MNKNKKKINWNDEFAKSIRVLGKALLKGLGWAFSILITIGLVATITGVIVGGAFLLYVKNHLDTSVDDFAIMAHERSLTTSISYVDAEGNIVELESERLSATENRMWVSYNDMGDYLPQAFIAIEDKRFESHEGVDWVRTIKVTLDYFLGGGSQGGSTITQQLIKNITGDDDVTIQRKAQEIFKAINLEKRYDKTEILEMYLNNIYLSQSCYGVGAASYTYFNKEPSELTLIEAAAIAAITQNPSKWDPIIHPENNSARRNQVIKLMYEQGRITQEEYTAAYKQELVLNPPETDSDLGISIKSWYTDAAQQEAIQLLVKEFGYTETYASKVLLTSGFNIITAQDPKVQEVLEYYYENDSEWPSYDDSPIQPKSAAVVIDPETGNVLGLVGDRGQKNLNLGLNYATQTRRPSGSSIKPLSVYGPGLEFGAFTYGSVFDDIPINFGKQEVDPDTGDITYTRKTGYPHNTPNRYAGLQTVHEAVRVSKNTVSWRALEALGLQNSYDYLTQKLGISTLVERKVNSAGVVFTDISHSPLAMGEFTYGVTVKEMTAAYQIFVNGGIFNEERIVLQILDSKGNVVIDNTRKSDVVMSAENAAIMTKMLEEVVDSGTATEVKLRSKIDCAGKTGTTSSKKDQWFVGYTPYYVCGIWFGYSMPRSLEKFSGVPETMWNKIMGDLVADKIEAAKNGGEPLKTFNVPKSVITATYCKDSGKLLTDACKSDPRGSRAEIGYFVIGTEPTEYCTTHFLVDRDSKTNGILTPYCPQENAVKVGLLNVMRQFPCNISVTDAQYTGQVLPTDYSYRGLSASLPYYQNMLPQGFFTGYSSKYFNAACITHINSPVTSSVQTPATASTIQDILNDLGS